MMKLRSTYAASEERGKLAEEATLVLRSRNGYGLPFVAIASGVDKFVRLSYLVMLMGFPVMVLINTISFTMQRLVKGLIMSLELRDSND